MKISRYTVALHKLYIALIRPHFEYVTLRVGVVLIKWVWPKIFAHIVLQLHHSKNPI